MWRRWNDVAPGTDVAPGKGVFVEKTEPQGGKALSLLVRGDKGQKLGSGDHVWVLLVYADDRGERRGVEWEEPVGMAEAKH